MTPIFYGHVISGKLALNNKGKFETYLLKIKGPVKLTVEKFTAKDQRSLAQNRYYWGVVVRMIAEEMGHIVPEDAHDYLRGLFLKRGIDVKGNRYEVVGSTTSLDTMQFEQYLEKCRMWAAQELSVNIPLPNEIVEDY